MIDFRSVIFLVCIFLVAVLGNAKKESLDNQSVKNEIDVATLSLKNEIDNAVLSLAQQDLVLPTSGYSLDILPVNLSLNDAEVYNMLRQTGDVSGNFTYNYSDIGTYTMSAQAIDGTQYLVNTFLEGYSPFQVDNVMMPLYILSQRKSYQLDHKQYPGRMEVWQSSRQAFYYPRGDCEDHAIVLADWLIDMGEDARVVIGDVEVGGGHAWVVLIRNGKEYLLEATKKSGLSRTRPYPAAVLHRDYHPRFMFNREYFWVNSGSKYTTNYSNQKWEKKSRYRDSLIETKHH